MIASATAEATKKQRSSLSVFFFGLDLTGVLSEIVDVFTENFHVLAGVFEGLAFRFGRDFVLIAGASATSEFHGEGDADITAFDVLRR
jgi:hypothetical protein